MCVFSLDKGINETTPTLNECSFHFILFEVAVIKTDITKTPRCPRFLKVIVQTGIHVLKVFIKISDSDCIIFSGNLQK